MRWLLLALGVLASLVLVAVAVGAMLPRAHVAARTVLLPVPPERVWALLTDVTGYARWRPDVRAVELLPAADGAVAWREDSRHGRITYAIAEAVPMRSLTTAITDPELPFGGMWRFTLEPTERGTRIVVTEFGEVRNPLFRFMSRFVFGHTATLDGYLGALARAVGADAAPAPATPHATSHAEDDEPRPRPRL